MARLQGQSTATYCAVIAESGDLSLGLGDMDIHQQITEKYVGCVNTKSLIKLLRLMSSEHSTRCHSLNSSCPRLP